MTFPGAWGDPDDEERLPTQAELDAQDLAEIARNSRDGDLAARYPSRPADAGPPPVALTRDAVWAWYLAALAALACIAYGFATLGSTAARLTDRLEPQMAQVQTVDAGASASSMGSFWPPALLIGWLIGMGVSYPLLVSIARHHSRNLRSIFAAVSVLIALFVPLAADLLFAYPEVPSAFGVLAWICVGALLVSVLMTFRGSVGRWLPTTTRIRPSRVWREN